MHYIPPPHALHPTTTCITSTSHSYPYSILLRRQQEKLAVSGSEQRDKVSNNRRQRGFDIVGEGDVSVAATRSVTLFILGQHRSALVLVPLQLDPHSEEEHCAGQDEGGQDDHRQQRGVPAAEAHRVRQESARQEGPQQRPAVQQPRHLRLAEREGELAAEVVGEGHKRGEDEAEGGDDERSAQLGVGGVEPETEEEEGSHGGDCDGAESEAEVVGALDVDAEGDGPAGAHQHEEDGVGSDLHVRVAVGLDDEVAVGGEGDEAAVAEAVGHQEPQHVLLARHLPQRPHRRGHLLRLRALRRSHSRPRSHQQAVQQQAGRTEEEVATVQRVDLILGGLSQTLLPHCQRRHQESHSHAEDVGAHHDGCGQRALNSQLLTFLGKNQKAATLAGEFMRKGCPTPIRTVPAITKQQLRATSRQSSVPAVYSPVPARKATLRPRVSMMWLAGKLAREKTRKLRMMEVLTLPSDTPNTCVILCSSGITALLARPISSCESPISPTTTHRRPSSLRSAPPFSALPFSTPAPAHSNALPAVWATSRSICIFSNFIDEIQTYRFDNHACIIIQSLALSVGNVGLGPTYEKSPNTQLRPSMQIERWPLQNRIVLYSSLWQREC